MGGGGWPVCLAVPLGLSVDVKWLPMACPGLNGAAAG